MGLPFIAAGASLLGSLVGVAGVVAQKKAGDASAKAAKAAGKFEAEGSLKAAAEMRKNIRIVELQSMIEENVREDEYRYLTGQNVANAAASGLSSMSASFDAIQTRNRARFKMDQSVASLNTENAKRQMRQQAKEHERAAQFQIEGGQAQAKSLMFQTYANMAQSMPRISINAPSASINPVNTNVSGGSVQAGTWSGGLI